MRGGDQAPADRDVGADAVSAVRADPLHAGGGQGRRGLLRRRAHDCAVAIRAPIEHQRDDHRKTSLQRGFRGDTRFGEVRHRLDEQGVRPFRGERAGLRRERLLHLLRGDLLAQEHFSGGAERGKDERRALRGLAGYAHAGAIDGLHLLLQSVLGQADAIGAEGVGEDHPASGLHVALGDFPHPGRLREIPLVRTGSRRQAAFLQLGSPRSVGQHRGAANELSKRHRQRQVLPRESYYVSAFTFFAPACKARSSPFPAERKGGSSSDAAPAGAEKSRDGIQKKKAGCLAPAFELLKLVAGGCNAPNPPSSSCLSGTA